MAIFAPILVPIVAPGFDAPTTELTIRMTRVMLVSPVLIGMGAVVTGILNSYQQFTVPAIAPLPTTSRSSSRPSSSRRSWASRASPSASPSARWRTWRSSSRAWRKVGQRYDLTIGLSHPGVRRVAWLMGPRTLGLAAGQINFLVSTVLASGLPEGSLTAYNYAFQLSQIPVGVIGVSIAVALFPTLSQDAALGRIGEIRRQVAGAVRVLVFVAAPLTAIMIVLREPLTSVFYQYGLFSQSATDRTASTLLFFALGLVGHIVVHVLTRAFYAMQDTRTPVAWAIVAVAINVPLMALLVGPMGVEGLALALSISSVLEVIGLLWYLRRRIESVDEAAILRTVVRSGVAGAGGGTAHARRPDAGRGLARVASSTTRSAGCSRSWSSPPPAAPSSCWWRPRCARPSSTSCAASCAPPSEERVIQFRPATDADADGLAGVPRRHAVRRLPPRLGVGRCRRLRRPAAAPLRRSTTTTRSSRSWRRRSGRWSAAARSGTCRTARCSTGTRPRRPERLRALRIGLRIAARQHRAIAVKLEPRIAEAGAPELARSAARPATRRPRRSRSARRGSSSLPTTRRCSRAFDKDTRYAVRRAEREGVVVDGHRGRQRLASHRRPPRPRRRDAAPRRLPAAAARALPGGVARAGRRRTGRHPRGASRRRAARVGHGRLRGHALVLPVQRLAVARSAASRSTTPATRCSGR